MNDVSFKPCGDGALTVAFPSRIDPTINARVCTLARLIPERRVRGVIETIPTFSSLTVLFDPAITTYARLVRELERLLPECNQTSGAQKRIFEIPVCYGEDFGEDLPDVAAHAKISAEEVIRVHSSTDYLIYMLGFLPGFAYLGGLDERIATPRLQSPRTKIPAGSVGIGGDQTGIYPLDSPGGWRLIGRTPVKPYDPRRAEPILYRAGDYIRFIPITRAEYDRLLPACEDGSYVCSIKEG
ncbi:MAG: 5-oxoprolinase subunit PxpB [Ruminococcaceae bacterium]|nr:5-oxoprolinase subunit PxpB [Oscillospiraceae bacterium]